MISAGKSSTGGSRIGGGKILSSSKAKQKLEKLTNKLGKDFLDDDEYIPSFGNHIH